MVKQLDLITSQQRPLLKAGGDISVNVLHGFLNEIWKVEELPEDQLDNRSTD